MESRYDDANAIEYHGFAKRNPLQQFKLQPVCGLSLKLRKKPVQTAGF
jgi:hypothetical protein